MMTKKVCICWSSIKMREGLRSSLEPDSFVSARSRECLRTNNQFSYRMYPRKC